MIFELKKDCESIKKLEFNIYEDKTKCKLDFKDYKFNNTKYFYEAKFYFKKSIKKIAFIPVILRREKDGKIVVEISNSDFDIYLDENILLYDYVEIKKIIVKNNENIKAIEIMNPIKYTFHN